MYLANAAENNERCLYHNGGYDGITYHEENNIKRHYKALDWYKGDLLSVHLDCDTWTIQFAKNGEKFALINIVTAQTYYFVLQVWFKDDHYQIIE